MKKLVMATIGAVASTFAVPANAADLAARPYTKAPAPMVATIYDWSGFYIGVNGGAGWSHANWDAVTAGGAFIAAEGSHKASGGTIGGQIGYRWQAANWVFGFEGQGNWADFSASNTSLAFPAFYNHTRVNSFGLITGQVGYSWNNVLAYVKGGAAVVGDRYDSYTVAGNVLAGSARETRWGAAVGAGIEFGFTPNWSLGFEYDHMFLGNRTNTLYTPAGPVFGSDRIRQDVDLALVRLNYRWGGPTVARY